MCEPCIYGSHITCARPENCTCVHHEFLREDLEKALLGTSRSIGKTSGLNSAADFTDRLGEGSEGPRQNG